MLESTVSVGDIYRKGTRGDEYIVASVQIVEEQLHVLMLELASLKEGFEDRVTVQAGDNDSKFFGVSGDPGVLLRHFESRLQQNLEQLDPDGAAESARAIVQTRLDSGI